MKKLRLCAALTALLCLTGCGTASPEAPAAATETETTAQTQTDAGTLSEPATETQPESNDPHRLPPLREFTAKTLDGAELTADTLAACDVTVINIWQTTCPPCIAEMPEIAELTSELPENVQFLTWCLDGMQQPDTAKAILDDACFIGETIVEWDGDLNDMLSYILYTPTTVFLDRDGNQIGECIIGSAEDAKTLYRDGINAALEELGLETIH